MSPAVPGAAASPGGTAAAIAPHLDPKHPISTERSVFFDYDEFAIRREYAALVERHGRYLAANPTLSVRIEGNSDERGSSEYNLALGQKRAQAVVSALRLMGVRDAQMEAVSWGEERPRNAQHDDAAWAENRRADIVYARR
jgi:peptidoglycan-associated lipoprotein